MANNLLGLGSVTILGKMGSGKTVLVIKTLVDYCKENLDDYRVIYANITGLKIKEEPFLGKIKFLDYDLLYLGAELEFKILNASKRVVEYDNEVLHLFSTLATCSEKNTYDEFLAFYGEKETQITLPDDMEKYFQQLRGFHFSHSYIIIDEFQNYFNKKDDVLVRWLSYHRHWYQNFIFIAPDLKPVALVYRGLSDHYILALPPHLRKFKNILRYQVYISEKMPKVDKINEIDVKATPKLFSYYQSGKNKSSTPVLYKFIGIAVFFIFIAYIVFKSVVAPKAPKEDLNVTKSVKSASPANKIDNIVQTSQDIKKEELDINIEAQIMLSFVCTKSACSYKDNIFPINLFSTLAKAYKFQYLSKSKFVNSQIWYFLVPDDFYSKFIKEKSQENNSSSNSLMPKFPI